MARVADEEVAMDTVNVLQLQLERDKQTVDIISATVDPDDIVEWFMGGDPIDQYGSLGALSAYDTGDSSLYDIFLEMRAREALADATGAATLAVSVLMPELLEDSETHWMDAINDLIVSDTDNSLIVNPDAETTIDDVILYLFATKFPELPELEFDDLNRLMIAADMLFASSANDAPERLGMFIDDGAESVDYSEASADIFDPEKTMSPRRLALALLSQFLFGQISDSASRISGESEPHARSLALKAEWMLAAWQMMQTRRPDQPNSKGRYARRKITSLLVVRLEDEFTGENRLQEADFGGLTTVNGVLHELLWFIEMSIVNDEQSSNLIVYPTLSYQDAPRLNYPRYNRGCDFVLLSPDKRDVLYVQLKSGNPKRKHRYHGSIYVGKEMEFKEMDPDALQTKLDAYRRYIDSESNSAYSELQGYLYPTTTEAMAKYKDQRRERRRAPLEFAAKQIGLEFTRRPSRAERRAAEKGLTKRTEVDRVRLPGVIILRKEDLVRRQTRFKI